jgi:tRNA(Ile)-lysidine synthase
MAAASPAPPLVERFRADLAALAGPAPGRLAVALSGGPDSLALLLLAAAAFPGKVAAATVDHGLRPESAAEAERAAAACARLGVSHAILPARVARRASIQAAAREARYAALAGWMAREGLPLLLTAHHLDDQAETLMMRLLRGSGAAGLAGIRPRVPLAGGASVCRPLLGWRRDELGAIVAAAGLEPVRDPSNEDEAYDRVRIRRALAAAAWIDGAALARSAAALAEADEALDSIADTLFAERARLAADAVAFAPAGIPDELLRRLLLRCLAHLEPAAAPRGDQLTALLRRLARGETAALAGILCSGGAEWRFAPAPPRRGSKPG